MPANTPSGLPYPLPTEPVAEGAQAIRNLAEALDARRIGSVLLAADAATVDFTAIPQTFANLRVLVYARGTVGATNTQNYMRFNNDTAANYDFMLSGFGASYSGNMVASQTWIQAGYIPAASAFGPSFGINQIVIPNYAGTAGIKNAFCESGMLQTAAPIDHHSIYGIWKVSVAINRITFIPGSGSFKAGSRFSLYGLP